MLRVHTGERPAHSMEQKQHSKPEQAARQKIDEQLRRSGWSVTRSKTAWQQGGAVAVEEWIFPNGLKADYLLFFKGKAIAVVEAKKRRVMLDGVYVQADGYRRASAEDPMPKWLPQLCFIYCANGEAVLFADRRDKHSTTRLVYSFHRPETLESWLQEGEPTRADRLRALKDQPLESESPLRDCQTEAIRALEQSFAAQKRRAYIHMSTGAGKTFTACTFCYRLLRYAKVRRILFLVDRTNLGTQAYDEFASWLIPEDRSHFTENYIVQHLTGPQIQPGARVVISTIQRIYSLLTGVETAEPEEDWEDRDNDQTEHRVEYNADLPPEFFDIVVIDECHRSIYKNWRRVTEYFDASLIGLTATPSPQTHAFFRENRVASYDYLQSVKDGINVGYMIYRIRTRITEQGGVLEPNACFGNYRRDQFTGREELFDLPQEDAYTANELNRRVESESQVRLVLETYRKAIYTDLFPSRASADEEYNTSFIPKTLIFARSDAHASLICRVAKEVFGRGDNFCQKVTYSVSGDKQGLIRSFRTDPKFRIAVTVDLVATGTDVKPLEVILFMRDVRNALYFQQMIGRACRTIGDDMLRNVTPNADSKDFFYLVDAVGVTEHALLVPQPSFNVGRQNSLAELMQQVADWRKKMPAEVDVILLGNKITRLVQRCRRLYYTAELRAIRCPEPHEPYDESPYLAAAEGKGPGPEELAAHLREHPGDKAWYDCFTPQVRRALEDLNQRRGLLLDTADDSLVESPAFSHKEAEDCTAAFEAYLAEHRGDLAALRFIYGAGQVQQGLLAEELEELRRKMEECDHRWKTPTLWRHYAILHPDRCRPCPEESTSKLGNLLQLVRYAARLRPNLCDFSVEARRRYNLWHGRKLEAGVSFTPDQRELLDRVFEAVVHRFATTPQMLRVVDASLIPRCHNAGLRDYIKDLTQALIA